MPTITDLMRDRVLLLDGGMGTQILANNPTVEDFGGKLADGCVELLNERRPEWIRAIHANYFDAGADAVETNTFGANEVPGVFVPEEILRRISRFDSAEDQLKVGLDIARELIAAVRPAVQGLQLSAPLGQVELLETLFA